MALSILPLSIALIKEVLFFRVKFLVYLQSNCEKPLVSKINKKSVFVCSMFTSKKIYPNVENIKVVH